jgi:hypothetical protein
MGKGVAAMKANKTEYQILSPVFEDCWKIFSAHFPHLQHPIMRIGRNKKTWGICYHYTQVRITLNKRLARTTLEFQHHVIFHELCHLIYPNHRREFYDLLDRFDPTHQNQTDRTNERLARMEEMRKKVMEENN